MQLRWATVGPTTAKEAPHDRPHQGTDPVKRADLNLTELYAVRAPAPPGLHERARDSYGINMVRFLSVANLWAYAPHSLSVPLPTWQLAPAAPGARPQGSWTSEGTGLLFATIPAHAAPRERAEEAAELLRLQLPDLDELKGDAAAQAVQNWRDEPRTGPLEHINIGVARPVQILGTWDDYASADHARQDAFRAEWGHPELPAFVPPVAAARAALAAQSAAPEVVWVIPGAGEKVGRSRVALRLRAGDMISVRWSDGMASAGTITNLERTAQGLLATLGFGGDEKPCRFHTSAVRDVTALPAGSEPRPSYPAPAARPQRLY